MATWDSFTAQQPLGENCISAASHVDKATCQVCSLVKQQARVRVTGNCSLQVMRQGCSVATPPRLLCLRGRA